MLMKALIVKELVVIEKLTPLTILMQEKLCKLAVPTVNIPKLNVSRRFSRLKTELFESCYS